MPDQSKHTLPPPHDHEDTAGFREDTLMLSPPRDAAALRHVGKLLHALALEAGPYYGSARDSQTRREMEAGLADLLHVRDFFWSVGRGVEESELSMPDVRLATFAKELQAALEKIVGIMQETLG